MHVLSVVHRLVYQYIFSEVDVSLHLLSIHELDEVKETLKSTGYLEIYWKDDFLTWNPADYGGLQYSFFPQDDVWKPDVTLKNSVVEYKQLGVSTLNVQVTATGEVYWYPYQASMPFHLQNCSHICYKDIRGVVSKQWKHAYIKYI